MGGVGSGEGELRVVEMRGERDANVGVVREFAQRGKVHSTTHTHTHTHTHTGRPQAQKKVVPCLCSLDLRHTGQATCRDSICFCARSLV